MQVFVTCRGAGRVLDVREFSRNSFARARSVLVGYFNVPDTRVAPATRAIKREPMNIIGCVSSESAWGLFIICSALPASAF